MLPASFITLNVSLILLFLLITWLYYLFPLLFFSVSFELRQRNFTFMKYFCAFPFVYCYNKIRFDFIFIERNVLYE